MQGNPAVPGGSLTSKPTWSNALGCSATSAFFMPKEDDVWNLTVSICDFILALPRMAWRATQGFVRNWWYARYH